MRSESFGNGFFKAGGALRPDSPSYVRRPADDELFDRVVSGEFCYILTPRQMGKSSLMVRTASRLKEQGMSVAVIDLTALGSGEISAEQWYLGLLTELQRKLRLSIDPEIWWQEHASLGRVQRFTEFLRHVILKENENQVVIFIDEIDATLQLDFTDDFFAAIRAMYNARANDPEFKRLTFVLLGVATPSDLIKDRTRTPFNIGHEITLQEFSRADASVLQDGLEKVHFNYGAFILDRIFYWTNGHPYLTQKLCLSAAETKSSTWTNERIDDLVNQLFLSEEARRETNLQFVRDGVQTSPNRRQLLKLYHRVYDGKRIPDDQRALNKNRLKLLGLVKPEHGVLKVRNEIYRRVFNLDWIKANTPIDWQTYIALASVFLTVFLAGIFGYLLYISPEQIDASQAETFITNFRQATSPDLRVTNLSNLFRIPGFEDRARELFFTEITFEEQVALFEKVDAQALGSRLIIIARGLYSHIDDNSTANQLLNRMGRSLRRVENDEAINIATEIEQWVKGRDYATQGEFDYALNAYNTVIDLNPDNIGTHFDRALAATKLDQYENALADFDAVLEIISRASPTPTPTGILTPTSTATPNETSNPSSPDVLTPTSVSTKTTAISTLASATTVALASTLPIQRFTNSTQIVAQVEEKIRSNALLLVTLSKNSSLYPNVAQVVDEFSIISTPSPTVSSTDTPIPTSTPLPPPLVRDTPSSTSSATVTPSLSTPIPTSIPEAIVVANELNLRFGPGTTYDRVGLLHQGDILDIQGRISDNSWIQVVPVRGILGWVVAEPNLVQINMDLNTVPIVPFPPTQIPLVTSTPTFSVIYSSPILTNPDNGVGTFGAFPTLFWTWDGELREDEFFEVRVWHESITYHPSLGWVKQPVFDYNLAGQKGGKYYWSVAIIKDKDVRVKDWYKPEQWPYPVWEHRPDKEDNSIQMSPESETRFFLFTP